MDIRPLAEEDVEEVVRLWNDTKRDTYGFLPQERGRSLADDDAFFRAHILPRCAIWIAVERDAVVGFLAIAASYVDRLYVHPTAQRRGVGTALLAKAIEISPRGIELHTHEKNTKARAFYDKAGFVAVRFGVSPPPESEPDVEYHWRP